MAPRLREVSGGIVARLGAAMRTTLSSGTSGSDAVLLRAAAEPFGRVLLRFEADQWSLAAGAEALKVCAAAIGAVAATPAAVIMAIGELDQGASTALLALTSAGSPIDVAVQGHGGAVLRISGRVTGALTLVWIWCAPEAPGTPAAVERAAPGSRTARGMAAALDRQADAQALILGAVGDAVALFDADRRLTYHNPAFARLWGLEPAWLADAPTHGALLDRLRLDRRLPEAADYGRFKAQELGRHERLEPAPEAIWRIAGERTLRVLSLPHPAGGLILLFSDITPEVRLNSQFNHLIQVQQATLDKLSDAVAVFGADGRLKLHNEAFQAFWSLPDPLLAARPLFDDIVERCVARLHDLAFWRALKGRITDLDPGVRAPAQGEALTADQRRVAWQSRPLPDGATLVSFVDVTDTRRLEGAVRDRESALAAAERLKREFVSSVSYELRTPLTTILGYAELLERTEQGLSARARDWVAAVRAAATDLARSVEDVLAFAELDAGEMTLKLGQADIATLLGTAAARARDRAASAGVDLEVASQDDPGVVVADADSLGRVLDHLIDHALNQTPSGGRVILSARRAFGEVCLEVSDTGRGIPFHVQARIFDRFSGEDGAGAGLGLALVKALVELHGGWVAVESAPGAGATFSCHLPEGGQLDPDPFAA